MPVSIYGHPCDMDEIQALADKYQLKVLEDAAESHGAVYKGKKTGNLADITTFSFFANKNLTTGEGGMVVTNDENLYNLCRYHKNMCFPLDAPRKYMHDEIGFNYRISNIHSAIGLAQVEKADEYRDMRIRNASLYEKLLMDIPGVILQKTKEHVLNVHWMNSLVIEPKIYGRTRDELIRELKNNNIDTRLLFVGMHKQPALKKFGCDCTGSYPISEWLTENGFYLPSASNLTNETITEICRIIKDYQN